MSTGSGDSPRREKEGTAKYDELERKLAWFCEAGWRQITEKVGLVEEVYQWREWLAKKGQETRVIGNDKAGGYYLIARRFEDIPGGD